MTVALGSGLGDGGFGVGCGWHAIKNTAKHANTTYRIMFVRVISNTLNTGNDLTPIVARNRKQWAEGIVPSVSQHTFQAAISHF
jgi:hypothetical protein